jgi:hypothetical protein
VGACRYEPHRGLFLAADEWGLDDEGRALATRQHGLRLQAEWEQAEAHRRRWQERFAGEYEDIVIYELRVDTPIVYESAEYRDKPALLMGHPDQPLDVILVPPDREHPWRRSSRGHVEDFGRRIAVRDAIEYAGAEFREWVIEQTALALGETLTAIRAVQDEALRGRDPQALAELTRLTDHAQSLSEGLQSPIARTVGSRLTGRAGRLAGLLAKG